MGGIVLIMPTRSIPARLFYWLLGSPDVGVSVEDATGPGVDAIVERMMSYRAPTAADWLGREPMPVAPAPRTGERSEVRR